MTYTADLDASNSLPDSIDTSILAFDLATRTGWSAELRSGGVISGCIDLSAGVRNKDRKRPRILAESLKWYRALIERLSPDSIIYSR